MKTPNRKLLCICGSVVLAAVLIGIVCAIIFREKTYTIEVKAVQWAYTIYIEEFKKVHYTSERYLPEGAYNVERRHKTETRVASDGDGKTHAETRTKTVYDYDLNEWVDSRQCVTSGFDKMPYFAEVELATGGSDGLGAEREKCRGVEYLACGVNGEETELIRVSVSEDIWSRLKVGDELNFKKRAVGDPYEIWIAE